MNTLTERHLFNQLFIGMIRGVHCPQDRTVWFVTKVADTKIGQVDDTTGVRCIFLKPPEGVTEVSATPVIAACFYNITRHIVIHMFDMCIRIYHGDHISSTLIQSTSTLTDHFPA